MCTKNMLAADAADAEITKENQFGLMLKDLFPYGLSFCDPFKPRVATDKGAILDVTSETASLCEDHASIATACSTTNRPGVPRSVTVPMPAVTPPQVVRGEYVPEVNESTTEGEERVEEAPRRYTNFSHLIMFTFLLVMLGTVGSMNSNHVSVRMSKVIHDHLVKQRIMPAKPNKPVMDIVSVEQPPKTTRSEPHPRLRHIPRLLQSLGRVFQTLRSKAVPKGGQGPVENAVAPTCE
jgi:hypothetical protein